MSNSWQNEAGTAIVSEGPWEETVQAVQAKLAANATRAITAATPCDTELATVSPNVKSRPA